MNQAMNLKSEIPFRKIVPITVMLFFSASVSYGQDLQAFYQAALKFDPKLGGAHYEHQASREILKQAWSELFPSLSLQGAYIRTWEDIKSSDNTVFAGGSTQYPTKSYTLALSQPVFDYSSILGVSRAREELRQYDARLLQAEQELILRVAGTYFQTLAAMDNSEFAGAEQTAVGRNYELARERHAMGLTSVQDMLDSRARYAYVSAAAIEAENALQDAFVALFEISGISTEAIMGMKKDLDLPVPDPIEAEKWVEIAKENSALLKERRSAVETARKEVRRLRAAHYPVLDLDGTDNWEDTDGSLFGGGSEVDTREVTLRLTVPIYQGGMTNSRVRQAMQVLGTASEQLREQTLAVERETRASFLGAKTALSKIEALAQAIEAQQMTLESKQEGFKSGLNTMISVLDAERDLYYARRDYAQARYGYVLNLLRLKHAAGILEEGDIGMVNAWLEGN